MTCSRPPAGWYCTRPEGHEGPCPTHPVTHPPDNAKIIPPTFDDAYASVQSGNATALGHFVYDNEPADATEASFWREQLQNVLDEIRKGIIK